MAIWCVAGLLCFGGAVALCAGISGSGGYRPRRTAVEGAPDQAGNSIKRERARGDPGVAMAAIRAALAQLPGWEISHPCWRSEERMWSACAYYAGPTGQSQYGPVVESTGVTEARALQDLAEALRTIAGARAPDRPRE